MAGKKLIVLALGLGLVTAATVEKRDGGGSYGGGYGGDYGTAMAPYGGPGGYPGGGMAGMGAMGGMGGMGAMGGMGGMPGMPPGMAGMGGAPGMPPQAPFGMQGFPDPGFAIQTGFEGYLVPNSWYGLMPWGAEGVVVVVTGVIVFIVIAVVILGLLAWLCGFGDYAIVREAARSFTPSSINVDFNTLADITTAVFDALDKYNEIDSDKTQKKLK